MPRRRSPVRLLVTPLERRDTPARLAYTPADIRGAYELAGLTFVAPDRSEVAADGAGQTIAVVTAFGSPTAAADLAEFSARFGLPAAKLRILDADGNPQSAPPQPPPGMAAWATETAADLQWAHAIAPGADLLLVTAHGTSDADLLQATQTARDTPGVTVVSMSFGRAEFPGEAAFDSVFTSPSGRGVSFVAASGDNTGSAQFLAYSPRVVGVGGTSLTLTADNRYQSETPWRSGAGGSGGGFSRYAPVPEFQRGEVNYPDGVRPSRGGPDVGWVADKLWVYDRSGTTAGPWLVSSGTSLAAPLWAGLFAVANQGRKLGGANSLIGDTQTLPLLYSAPPVAFRDIPDPGYPAAGPWDWSTGLGTPRVPALITHLLQGIGGLTVTSAGSADTPTSPPSTEPPTSPPVNPPPPTSGGPTSPPTTPPVGGAGRPPSQHGGLIVTGSGWGVEASVTGYDSLTGAVVFQVDPLPGFSGGVRVASVQLGDDGETPDVLVVTGPGTAPELLLLDGATGKTLKTFDTFEDQFSGGLFVAEGDLDGDGVPDFVITPDEGGGPRVLVVSGRTGERLADFFGIDDVNFRGGARAAVGDLDGDGRADLVVAAGYGGGPRVAVFDGRSIVGRGVPVRLVGDFFAMDPALRNGLYVAAGDVSGRGRDDLLLGAGPGGAPRVLVVDGLSLIRSGRITPLADFYAGEKQNRGGAPVAVTRLADGTTAVLVGSGRGGGTVKVFTSREIASGDPVADRELTPASGLAAGVYVG